MWLLECEKAFSSVGWDELEKGEPLGLCIIRAVSGGSPFRIQDNPGPISRNQDMAQSFAVRPFVKLGERERHDMVSQQYAKSVWS